MISRSLHFKKEEKSLTLENSTPKEVVLALSREACLTLPQHMVKAVYGCKAL